MLGGLTMCELSVNDGVDKTGCDDLSDGVVEWVLNEMMNAYENENDKNWSRSWNTSRYRNWVQNNLMDGSNTWNRNWRESWRRDGLTSPSIESVGQAVEVTSDKRCRQITFGIDTAACRTVVLARHPATRGYRCLCDAAAGAQYSTAGKSVVWDEGWRLLVSKDPQGRLLTIESRQADVRKPLMAVKAMTQQGQWGLFWA